MVRTGRRARGFESMPGLNSGTQLVLYELNGLPLGEVIGVVT